MKNEQIINRKRIPVFITARMGSTRLPGKHLLEINNQPVIKQMINRVKYAKLPPFFVLCTTSLSEDNIFEDIANQCGIKIYRGHPTDILKRWLDAADFFRIKYFISAEADDVFCDPDFIDRIILEFQEHDYDYITCKGLPFGVTPTGIRVDALRKICALKKESDTEGQERYFTKTGLFNVHYIHVNDPAIQNTDLRMTLDYNEDYTFFKTVFSYLYHDQNFFSLKDILSLIKEHPEIADINKKMQNAYEERYTQRYGNVTLKKE